MLSSMHICPIGLSVLSLEWKPKDTGKIRGIPNKKENSLIGDVGVFYTDIRGNQSAKKVKQEIGEKAGKRRQVARAFFSTMSWDLGLLNDSRDYLPNRCLRSHCRFTRT